MSAPVPYDRIIRQSDDLLPHHLKGDRVALRKDMAKGPPKVTNSGVLMTVGQQAMQKLVDNAHKTLGITQGDDLPRYREHLTDKARWAIPNLLNNVTEAGFYNMVVRQADGARGDIIRPQPNGDWQPVAFRFIEVMDDLQNIPYLHLVIRWMDLKNETEIKYHAGAPISAPTVNVSTGDSGVRELAEAIQNKDADNGKLMDMLTQLLADRKLAPETQLVEATPQGPRKVEAKPAGKPAKSKLPPGV